VLTINGIKLKFLLENMMLDKIINKKKKDQFNFPFLDQFFVRSEIPNIDKMDLPLSSLHGILEREDIVKEGLSVTTLPVYEKSIQTDMASFAGLGMPGFGMFKTLYSNSEGISLGKDDMMSIMNMDTFPTGFNPIPDNSPYDSEDDEKEPVISEHDPLGSMPNMSGYSLLKQNESPQAMLMKPSAFDAKRNTFLNTLGTQEIWKDLIDLILDNMIIKEQYFSKIIYLLLFILNVKFSNYQEIFTDSVYRTALQKIWALTKKYEMDPQVEYFPEYNLSLRMTLGLEKKKKIDILGLKIGRPDTNFHISEERKELFHITEYKIPGSHMYCLMLEKKLNDNELKNLVRLYLKNFYLDKRPCNENCYQALMWILSHSSVPLLNEDAVEDWFS
jgi:hypothetical protein